MSCLIWLCDVCKFKYFYSWRFKGKRISVSAALAENKILSANINRYSVPNQWKGIIFRPQLIIMRELDKFCGNRIIYF